MKRIALAAVLSLVLLSGNAMAKSAHDHHGQAAAPAKAVQDRHAEAAAKLPVGVNAVQNEMRELSTAMNEILLAVANNNLKVIPESIHRVHSARQLTEAAIESGHYKLPKNSDKMAAFIKEDDAFHEELVALMKASKTNDLNAATKQVGRLVNGCTSCHTQYRF